MNQPYCEDEMETLHVYIYEEPPTKPSHGILDRVLLRVVQALAVGMLAVFCLIPYVPVYAMKVLAVPAHFLPIQMYSAQSSIVPTGKTEHPAVQARGTLTIYNGSILVQQFPAGFLFAAKDGLEVATDQSVTIPAANLPSLGMATVPAHAVAAGSQGNIQAGQINQDYGTAVTIKNLSAFQGGQDAYTEQFVTAEDTVKARESAKEQAAAKIPIGLLARPCTAQTAQGGNVLTVTWSCQYVTYTAPANLKVLSAHVEGKNVILQVSAVVLPR